MRDSERLYFYWGGSFGQLVEFFFILSGYYALGYINRLLKKEQYGKEFFGKFIRLFSPAILTIIAYEVVMLFYFRASEEWFYLGQPSWRGILLSLFGLYSAWFNAPGTFDGPNPVLWYADSLLLCFAILTVIVWLSKKLRTDYMFPCMIMVLAGIAILQSGENRPLANWASARGYDSFFVGILLRRVVGNLNEQKKGRHLLLVTSVISLFISISFIVLRYFDGFLLTFVLYPSAIALAVCLKQPQISEKNVISLLGETSYEVFIWHFPIEVFLLSLSACGLIRPETLSNPVFVTAFIIVVWLFSMIMYCLVEGKLVSLTTKVCDLAMGEKQ